jgi:hypothetical protein
MLRLLAQEVPAAQLHEVRRFDAHWEREASIRLRGGDLAAVAAYDRHGRIRGADQETAYDRAASMWLAAYLRGKNVLLLAGSNAEAAELSHREAGDLSATEQIRQDQEWAGGTGHLRQPSASPAANRRTTSSASRRPPWRGGHGSAAEASQYRPHVVPPADRP